MTNEPGPAGVPEGGGVVNRRHLLVGAGIVGAGALAGVFVIPQWLGRRAAEPDGHADSARSSATPPADFQPHAFVRISSDGAITVMVGKSEMGQGIHTGIAMIVAEQLDVSPSRVRAENAPVDPAFNQPMQPLQMTGSSNSTMTTFDAASRAGATARAMLVAAAAQQWGVAASSLSTDDGVVTDGARSASYGELAARAALQPVPSDVPLKARADYRYLGRRQARLDSPSKVDGSAVFGIDVRRPDMLYAMVARSPVFGGKLVSFDASAARAIRGVVDIRQVPSGVAVLATDSWIARRARDALVVRWDEGEGANLSAGGMRAEWRRLAGRPAPMVAKVAGTPDAALAACTRKFDVAYELPYLAHACMEPMNATAMVTQDRCEIWAPTQNQTLDRDAAARVLGFETSQVELHTTFLGGGFGRRASSTSDFVVEAVEVARGVGRPVKTYWSREDDMRGGFYRPYSLNRVRAGIDDQGRVQAFWHTSIGKGVVLNSPFAEFARNMGFDPSSVEGSATMPYAIPNLRVDMHATEETVPILWWRSVGHSINGFVVNSAIDELAALGGRDPLELRRELLAGMPRHLAVLEKAATLGEWGRPLAAGRGRGIALQESFGSIVAEVVEASVAGSDVVVHRVACAVDCGFAINPDQVVAQMESGIIFGLSAALRGEITLERGRVRQSNFHDYPILQIGDTPRIDVEIVGSDGPLGGIGEPGMPPVAPALTGAIFAATGRRIRRLPVSASLADA